jgi:hypothetical protein
MLLSFPNGVSCSAASDIHFIDGYAQTYRTTAFILPVVQSGFYAPVSITHQPLRVQILLILD